MHSSFMTIKSVCYRQISSCALFSLARSLIVLYISIILPYFASHPIFTSTAPLFSLLHNTSQLPPDNTAHTTQLLFAAEYANVLSAYQQPAITESGFADYISLSLPQKYGMRHPFQYYVFSTVQSTLDCSLNSASLIQYCLLFFFYLLSSLRTFTSQCAIACNGILGYLMIHCLICRYVSVTLNFHSSHPSALVDN